MVINNINIDDAVHRVYLGIDAVRWHDWREVGIDDDYHEWYYAENQLYVIRDRILGYLKLIEARSPKQAYEIWQDEVRSIAIGVDYETN